MDAPITPILCRAIERHLGQTLTPEVASQLAAEVITQCFPGPVDFSDVQPKQVGSYRIECARVKDTLDPLKALHAEHWRETEGYRHDIAFNPDYARLLDIESQGRYFLIIATHSKTGALVGNYGLYLAKSVHTQTLGATEDTLFVTEDHRRGRLGVEMIRYAERALFQLGVSELNVSVKQVNRVGQMIERMGYAVVATQYNKILKEPSNVLI